MHDFRQLHIWQNARHFTKKIYLQTNGFPKHEIYGLISQMRRAAVSIPSNIAESCGRSGIRERRQFLDYALASAFELETQLLLSSDLMYLEPDLVEALITELQGIQKGIYFFKKSSR